VPPSSDEAAKFDGVSIAAVLADVVELKKGVDTAVFHGKDGYTAPVSIAAIRQLRPVLADTVDGSSVTAWRDGASPLVLAWPNVDQPGIDTDPRMRWWWVQGVTQVEMQSWVASYGRALRVPAGASDDARLGADAFSVQCMNCHKLRNVGGTRGPDLTAAASRKDFQSLASSMREHLQRVGPPGLEPGSAALRQIAAFLREIDIAGSKADADEIQVPEPQAPPSPATPGSYPPPHVTLGQGL
jgi:mono/diheme cytochrome c family protein